MKSNKSIIAYIIAIVMLCSILTPIGVVAAADAAPDGNHTLSEIFPGSSHDYLAEQIGYYLDQPVTYKPANATDFDEIVSVSCANSYVPSLKGLQYLQNLENLYLMNNDIGSAGMVMLPQLSSSLTALNLSGNGIDSSGLNYLRSLSLDILALADNEIGDDGLENLPNSLTDLDMSGNNISDVGAKKIAGLGSLTELNLSNNHIGIDGMKAIAASGITSLEMNEQTITLPALINGRRTIELSPPGGIQYVVPGSISNGGKVDAKGVIVWPAQREDVTLTYDYAYQGYTGTAYVPFHYEPFVYTVTLNDMNGHVKNISVNDLDQILIPTDPVRKEYVFHGWSVTKDGTQPFNFNTSIEKNITLYARWGTALPPKYYKFIDGVYAEAKDNYIEVTWNRVKSAKGYFVYKYSAEKKKYVKVATLEGRSKHIWSDSNVKAGKKYKYKVQPYKIVNKKKKGLKASYWVNAVFASDVEANALKVELSKTKTITKKAGKTVKLNATVSSNLNKALVSSKVRWYVSNNSIATVNKNGKVSLKKKGTCYIWAKAYNGVNSKKIKIIVT